MQHMCQVLRLIGARKGIEVGVFLGYGTLAFALALPDDGRVVGLDVSSVFVDVGRPYWQKAGVAHKIDIRVGPAVQSLRDLLADARDGDFNQYDFAFIDADKANYGTYYDLLLELIRPGGVIFIDNVLWHGRVVDPACQDADTCAIRALNARIATDPRVDVSMLTVGDGLTVAIKRAPTLIQARL
jgi:predicted O-methyltransferase YrrM